MIIILACLLGFVLAARATWLLTVYRNHGSHPMLQGFLLGWLASLALSLVLLNLNGPEKELGLWLATLGTSIFLAGVTLLDDEQTRVERGTGAYPTSSWWDRH